MGFVDGEFLVKKLQLITHYGSMGRTVYLPTFIVDVYGFHVGKYTSHMDP